MTNRRQPFIIHYEYSAHVFFYKSSASFMSLCTCALSLLLYTLYILGDNLNIFLVKYRHCLASFTINMGFIKSALKCKFSLENTLCTRTFKVGGAIAVFHILIFLIRISFTFWCTFWP